MSHVGSASLHIYQDEDWHIELALSGEGAPDDLTGWSAWMEIRASSGSASSLAQMSTTAGEITVVSGSTDPTFAVDLANEVTRDLPVGTHKFDFFAEDPVGDRSPWFAGNVTVTARITVVEEFA